MRVPMAVDGSDQGAGCFLWDLLLTLFRGVTLIHPVRAQIVGNVEDLQLCETLITECFVCRLYVRAVVPGAASTIDNDEPVSVESLHTLLQLLHHCFIGCRTEELRTRNVGLGDLPPENCTSVKESAPRV